MIKSTLKSLSNILPVPGRLRYALMKFYLTSVERAYDTYFYGITAAHLRSSLKLWQIINRDQGYLRSFAEGRCLDAAGQPVPWYTYPAIEHLDQLDFSGKNVFEYGAGNSTLWWANRAKSVTSVEIREPWYDQIKATMPGNCHLMLETDPDKYIESIKKIPDGFDVIVVDGYARKGGRLRCSAMALESLRPNGLIILDNADWLPMSAQYLRNAGLLEVNMCGFSPLNSYAGVTALYFTRDCDLGRKDSTTAARAVGGAPRCWEKETNVPTELRAELKLRI